MEKISTIKLKNCPICNGKIQLFLDMYDRPNALGDGCYKFICSDCGACIGFTIDKSEDEVVDLWNRTAGYDTSSWRNR